MKIKILCSLIVLFSVSAFVGWKAFGREKYETASYEVTKSDGDFEVRKYPDLELVVTSSAKGSSGDDGSFMRLFRYISGENEAEQKIAMTTPVFMDRSEEEEAGRMGFMIPAKVAESGAPSPKHDKVDIKTRPAGEFAVYRFSGRLDSRLEGEAKKKLFEWIEANGLTATGEAEFAGYDPPWTPGPMRRNEVLIRLK